MQSFVDSEARASGRLHSRATVEEDIERLRAAGIANLNVDLIAGLAGQNHASWEESLAALIASGVPHASIYMLEVDEDSRLGRELLAHGSRYGAALVPGDDAIARMYELAIERLDAAGLRQYEISNFARPGFESRHNLRYWQRRPYLGVGLDASSMLRSDPTLAAETEPRQGRGAQAGSANRPVHLPGPRDVLRASTADDLAAYLAGPSVAGDRHGSRPSVIRRSMVPWAAHERGRRHRRRWNANSAANCSIRRIETAARLVNDGLLAFDGDCVRLTPRGRLLSNDVFQEFLAPRTAKTP